MCTVANTLVLIYSYYDFSIFFNFIRYDIFYKIKIYNMMT